jgi:hypothetical protein
VAPLMGHYKPRGRIFAGFSRRLTAALQDSPIVSVVGLSVHHEAGHRPPDRDTQNPAILLHRPLTMAAGQERAIRPITSEETRE